MRFCRLLLSYNIGSDSDPFVEFYVEYMLSSIIEFDLISY